MSDKLTCLLNTLALYSELVTYLTLCALNDRTPPFNALPPHDTNGLLLTLCCASSSLIFNSLWWLLVSCHQRGSVRHYLPPFGLVGDTCLLWHHSLNLCSRVGHNGSKWLGKALLSESCDSFQL